MKKNLLLCLFFLAINLVFSKTFPKNVLEKTDSTTIKNPDKISDKTPVHSPITPITTVKKPTHRTFESLDQKLSSSTFSYAPSKNEFTANYIKKYFPKDSTINIHILEAKAMIDQLEVSGNYIDLVTPEELVTLPVAIKGNLGSDDNGSDDKESNVNYVLGITKARFTPEYTEVTAFVKITIPQKDTSGQPIQLFFGADNIKLSHKGGIYGDANLVLLGDVAIPINGGNGMVVLRGGFNMQTGNINKQTYVSIDCSGFKELRLSADVLFPRSLLEPVDVNYNVIPDKDKKVMGHFQTIVGDWNDIMAEISLPPFQLTKNGSSDGTGKAGLVFELNTAVFDFSDFRNSPNINFPKAYSQLLIPGQENLWRGVYVDSLKVVLPEQFKLKNSDKRVVFGATDMLIDGMGVSGSFSVDNLMPLNEGEASGWQFSVDHLEANFVVNQLVEASFDGQIVLPVTKEVTAEELQKSDSTTINKKALSYVAIIDPENEDYILSAGLQEQLSFDIFKAKAALAQNSYVELKVKQGRFRPKAVLHGNLNIAASNSDNADKKTVDFKGIVFEHMQLQTESPYFQVDYMGYKGDVALAGFPVTISEIGVTANEYEASLRFGVDINMMEKGFSGGTTLTLVGAFSEKNGYQRWSFDRLKLDRIAIGADLGAIKLDGFIDIKDNDPVYGDGFYGQLSADFNQVKVSASAWFGKKDFRYWYVDAFADLSQSEVKAYIGPAIVNGFGGGAYYRMSRRTSSSMPIYNGDAVVLSPPAPSGLDYIPDGNAGIGFRAMIGFALANEKAFNGKVGFEMAFNRSGGLNRILFFGEGHIVKALDFKFGEQFKQRLNKLEDKINGFGAGNKIMERLKESNLVDYSKVAFPQDGLTFDKGIDANFSMEMDFKNRVFHSEMEIYVNTPGGFFQGVGTKGRAGWAVFHAGPDAWYLHAGTPKDRVGIQLGLGNSRIKAASYLMIGDKIPGSPPPPPIVAQILGTDLQSLDYMRDLNALGEGRGFAFGMDFSVDTGDMTFLMFYARFQAGLGFDIMIKDYGEAACKKSGQIGIDGWYANGQAYAYLQGELGIKIKLLFVRKKIPIITAGAAVLLQAKLPNPAWFRGYVGGHFNVLGIIKGRFRFKIELGEECELVGGSPLGGLKVISDVTPADNTKEVDVFTVPQTTFNMQINKPFELEDDQGVKTYRILLEKYSITNQGKSIEGTVEWNENGDIANFISYDILPPNKTLKITATVIFQERNGNSWSTMTENGKVARETEIRNFTTGEAPEHIPLSNIVYSYPVVEQQYFYQKERSQGYVQLRRGQPYLFAPETNWNQSASMQTKGKKKLPIKMGYDTKSRKVFFDIPSLQNKEEYVLQIISITPEQKENSNQKDTYSNIDTGQKGTTIAVKNKQAQTVVKEGSEVEILNYSFSTSIYNTFSEKIKAKTLTKGYLEPIYSDVHALQADVTATEPFELVELQGGKYTNNIPLINTEAVLDDAYYKETIYPLIYKGYPLEGRFTVNRNVSELGIPPKKAIDILTWYPMYLEHGVSDQLMNIRIPYRYYLPYYYKRDYAEIQYKIVNAYLHEPSLYANKIQQYNYIINEVFPPIQTGDYKVRMQYILPGGINGSGHIFKYNNPY